MTHYSPSRSYLSASVIAVVLGVCSAWIAVDWTPAVLAAALFFASALCLFFVATRPSIQIQDEWLLVGRKSIRWEEIRRVDRTGWMSPLVVYLTVADGKRHLVIYPGDSDSSQSLLRQLRQRSWKALIDGIPFPQFWGEEPISEERQTVERPKYRILRKEDEEEVERLYRRLKSVGHLGSGNSEDE